MIKFDKGNDIFYSGDTYEMNINIVEFLKNGNLVYYDICIEEAIKQGFNIVNIK